VHPGRKLSGGIASLNESMPLSRDKMAAKALSAVGIRLTVGALDAMPGGSSRVSGC
jgi:hypothetical protein